jgi:hypothetical protein
LSDDWQTTNRPDNRDEIKKARDAANALFKPKRLVSPPEVPLAAAIGASTPEQHVARQPRIIAIPSVSAVGREIAEISTGPARTPKAAMSGRRAKISPSEHDRVRTLVMYGMTHGEVARLYSVSMNVIERIVAGGTDDHSSAIE